jgi:hypothetical protein
MQIEKHNAKEDASANVDANVDPDKEELRAAIAQSRNNPQQQQSTKEIDPLEEFMKPSGGAFFRVGAGETKVVRFTPPFNRENFKPDTKNMAKKGQQENMKDVVLTWVTTPEEPDEPKEWTITSKRLLRSIKYWMDQGFTELVISANTGDGTAREYEVRPTNDDLLRVAREQEKRKQQKIVA